MKPYSETEVINVSNTALETGRQTARTDREQADVFFSRFTELSQMPTIQIPNVLMNHPEDQLLALVASMRRRSPIEYESVVRGLQQMATTEQDKRKKHTLEVLAGNLMDVGEILFKGEVDFH